MKTSAHHISTCVLAVSFFLGGCSYDEMQKKAEARKTAYLLQQKKAAEAKATPKPTSYWLDDGNAVGPPRIEIALSEQRAYFYKGENLVGVSRVSSGKKGFETPLGSYKVIQKDKDHVSNLYGDYVNSEGEVVQRNVDVTKDPLPPGATFKGAKMSYFLRFTGGYGMHAGRLPGFRASHGCVRMPRTMAEHFFQNAELGTPVTVKE
jgi:lipoprotein-anchoring transpeptidase ErfK/SrfK